MEPPPSAETTCAPHPPVHSQLLSRLPRAKHFERDQHSLFSISAALSRMQLQQETSGSRGGGGSKRRRDNGAHCLGCPAGITEEEKTFIYSGSTLINVVPEVKNRPLQKCFVLTLWRDPTSTAVTFLLLPFYWEANIQRWGDNKSAFLLSFTCFSLPRHTQGRRFLKHERSFSRRYQHISTSRVKDQKEPRCLRSLKCVEDDTEYIRHVWALEL